MDILNTYEENRSRFLSGAKDNLSAILSFIDDEIADINARPEKAFQYTPVDPEDDSNRFYSYE